jgi:glycerol kinase
MPKYIAAIDQGTTSTRCMLFDPRGQIAAVAQKEHAQIYPQPGWVEHDPLEIWARTQEVIREAVAACNARLGRHPGGRRHQPARDHPGVG